MLRRLPGFLALSLCLAAPLGASDVTAGIDLWITPADDPGTTTQILVPAGFFGTNSDAVNVTRTFHGQPLTTDPDYPPLAPADTVLERPETAHLTVCGSAVTVPLKIAALHLQAESPLTVTYGGGSPESWRVEAFLSKSAQATGSLELQQSCDAGGTLISHVKVRPRFLFTRLSDNVQIPLDWDTYPDSAPEIEFSATGSWARSAPDGYPRTTVAAGARVDYTGDGDWHTLAATTSDFVVGMEATPCSCTSSSRAGDKVTAAEIKAKALQELALLISHLVHPCSDTGSSYPSHAPGNPVIPPLRRPNPLARALRLAPMGLLVLAAGTAVPWRRRPRKKPADRG